MLLTAEELYLSIGGEDDTTLFEEDFFNGMHTQDIRSIEKFECYVLECGDDMLFEEKYGTDNNPAFETRNQALEFAKTCADIHRNTIFHIKWQKYDTTDGNMYLLDEVRSKEAFLLEGE